jgi:hypothetical protein
MNLLGLTGLDQEVDGFLLRTPTPGSTEVANFLKLYPGDSRDQAARALIAKGVPAATVASALTWLTTAERWKSSTAWSMLSVASGAASAYHGYKRNQSIGWGVWWFLMGSIFPIITPAIGLAQGFGKRKT